MMDNVVKKNMNKELRIPFAIMMAAVLLMVATVFLPYAVAVDTYKLQVAENPDIVIYEELNLTTKDMEMVSIFDFTKLYYTLCEELWNDSAYGIFYVVIFALLIGFTLVTGLLGIKRRPIGAIFFDVLAFGVFYFQNMDYTMRGVIPGDRYDWGIAYYLFPVAAAVVLLVTKKRMSYTE